MDNTILIDSRQFPDRRRVNTHWKMNDENIRAALAELRRERRQVKDLRSQYRKLIGSRFFALRAIWLAVHGTFGWGKRREAYIASNMCGLTEKPTWETEAPIDERAVAAAWEVRAATVDNPIVTVIIPVYNHLSHTLRCLHSLAQACSDSMAVEIIVVDDASDDSTETILSAFHGIRYLRNSQNLGFLRSCNFAARHARGKYICFLNNDTIVQETWLDQLLSTAERDHRVGAVGAKLIYPTGILQEAGAIIWSNGEGWNYGRGGDPADSRYNFERDVDYCSGAALLVRRALFEEIGGFDDQFAPAYYEDVDLCFAIRQGGYRVIYQPKSEVVHLEGASSGTDTASGVKRFQERNRTKFEQKWRALLAAHHFQHNSSNVEQAARRLRASPRVLFIDSYVPMHDREAGSNRLMHIISYLCKERYSVTFLPDNYAALQPYTSELQAKGVEVLYHTEGAPTLETALKDALEHVEFIWICRPELFTKYAPQVRAISNARIIYDTIDLHFVRKQREAQTLGQRDSEWREYERMEIAAATNADATIAVSDTERDILESRGIRRLYVIPTVHDRVVSEPTPFNETSGLLFIGNYNHSPNVDAASWLCGEVMPRVWKSLPQVSVTLLGSDPTPSVQGLASRRIRVTGYAADVGAYFSSARLFVAPIRFGAGLKGKVGQAMAYGLPIIATDIAVEGFGMANGTHCVIANDADEFAAAIVRAYADKDAWERMSRALLEKTGEYSSSSVGANVVRLLHDLSELASSARK